MRIYVASKTKHAPMWLELRNKLKEGPHSISSTWIDEAGEGESPDYEDLADRCIEEAKSSDITILYCENGDVLKGALVEVGAALAAGKDVYQVGNCESISRVFAKHEKWTKFSTLDEALATI